MGVEMAEKHIPRFRWSLKEDSEAKNIAKSERQAHPEYSKERSLSIGYATVAKQRWKHKRK